MKIALIHPPITSTYPRLSITEPLGLAYLSAVIKKEKHDVTIIDCIALNKNKVTKLKDNYYRIGLSDEEIIKEIKTRKPDIIGISSNFTIHKDDVLNLAKLLKKHFNQTKILLGGVYPTMEHSKLIKNDFIDFVIRGEGEITIVELLNSLEQNKDLKNVLGLTYKNNGKIIVNNDRPLIKDLDSIPLPDREAIDMNYYLNNSKETFYYALNQPVSCIITSRGCPYNCIFCSTKNMWRRVWRPHSAKRVFKEILEVHKKYGAKEIVIYDDSFILDKKRVKEICELIIKSKIGITLNAPAGLSAWVLDEETIKIMKKAGFYRICIPIESGSKRTLRFIRKPVDLEKTKKLIQFMNRNGIWTTANFIIGFPYETKKDIERTIEYACNCGVDHAIFYVAQPYSGAEMYDIYKKEKLITKEVPDAEIESAYYPTKNFSIAQLNELAKEARSRFYRKRMLHLINPIFFCKNILPKITNIRSMRYVLGKALTYLTKDIINPQHFKFIKKNKN